MLGELHQLSRAEADAARRRNCSPSSPCPTPPTGWCRGTRAGCGAASTSPPRSSPTRRCSSSTSRRPGWTRAPARTCGRCSRRSSAAARRCSSPPSTSRRPSGWPTTSSSIDHGRIIARGDARKLKREVGGDQVQVVVAEPEQLDQAARIVADVTGIDTRRRRRQPLDHRTDEPWRRRRHPRRHGPARGGDPVEDLSLRQPTLDEVFLTLTGSMPDDSEDVERELVEAKPMTAITTPFPAGTDAALPRPAWRGPRHLGDRPPRSGPHAAPAGAAQRRHDPADHVRAAVRLRVRRGDRRARRRQLPGVPDGWDLRPDDRVRRLRRRPLPGQRPQEPGGRPLPLAPDRQGGRARRPRRRQPAQVAAPDRDHVALRPDHRLAHPQRHPRRGRPATCCWSGSPSP